MDPMFHGEADKLILIHYWMDKHLPTENLSIEFIDFIDLTVSLVPHLNNPF